MASSNDEIAVELLPLNIRQYKDGRVERGFGTTTVVASLDAVTGAHSKDVIINPDTGLSARIFIPKINNNTDNNSDKKLPLLVYFHGGGFCIESAFSPMYYAFCNSLATSASCVIVSVNYRLAPENPIPTPYEDCWEAVKWVVSGNDDKWLKEYADFDRVFFAGDSAGANIAHHLALRVGSELSGSGISGVVFIHPYFWGKEAIEGETNDANARGFMDLLWKFVFPDCDGSGVDHVYLNPNTDPKYSDLCCDRVLICVAENDMLKARGRDYYEKLGASEWKGKVEFLETKGENHIFHLLDQSSENAKDLVKRLGSFLNNESP